MDKIFTDENSTCKFYFTNLEWATDGLNAIYHDSKIDLCDVDFIIETCDFLYLVEYKNANIANATNPDALYRHWLSSFQSPAGHRPRYACTYYNEE